MPAAIVCLLSPFCVCLPMQPGVSNTRSGPHGRWDTTDWSQRVLSALPGVRLHHHTAGRHVRETFHAHVHPPHTPFHLHLSSLQQLVYSSALSFNLLQWFICDMNLCPQTIMGGKKRESYQKMGGSSWRFSKNGSNWEKTAAHFAPEQFLMQMSVAEAILNQAVLKCIDSAREESICPRYGKTWAYSLTFSCSYRRQSPNNGSPNAYKTNVCHTFYREGSSQVGA